MRIPVWAFLVFLGAAIVSGGAAFTHEGATGVVKERMELMKDIAAQMKALKPMIDGGSTYEPARVATAAGTIADHAANIAPSFPKGSNVHPSEASPRIWTEWDGFAASARALRTHAAALQTDAEKGAGAAKALFGEMARTCKGCHEDYRIKKQ